MRPCTLFYSVRNVEDIAFRDEIALLERRFTNFRAFITVTDGSAASGHFSGRISEALVTAMAPDIAHAMCLLCGPQPMLDGLTEMLVRLGVPRAQIAFEVFQAAVAASARAPSSAPVDAVAAPREGAHEVRFTRSGLAAAVPAHQTMLEAAEGCGAGIPSLCRAGVCGTCRTRVLSGDVNCASQVLDEQDRHDGYVLACATEIRSDCTVDA
jgi:ferredoxin-NADP reductase